jgi:crossover junction endodeoxyribonuclease RuvC
MKVLGIDPGTVTTGYGVIESENDELTVVDYGAIRCPARSPIGERLFFIYRKILEVISRCKPDAVAIEEPFVARNVKSAMAVGRAQAVAMLAAASRGIPSYGYSPAQVKQRVADYGASSKEQVQEMVRLQLGMKEVPQPADASDALAVALCHLREVHLSELLKRQGQG